MLNIKSINEQMDLVNRTMNRIEAEDAERLQKLVAEKAEAEMMLAIRRARGLEPMPEVDEDGNEVKEKEPEVDEESVRVSQKMQELAESLEDLSQQLAEAVQYEKFASTRLEQRILWEEVCQLLLGFLDTVPQVDKELKPMTLHTYRAHIKMIRSMRDQLTRSRILVRVAMERWEDTNDHFCGRRELLLFSGCLRSIGWIKAWMKWYKYTEHKVELKRIGKRIGLNSAEDVLRDAFGAFVITADNARWERDLVREGEGPAAVVGNAV